MPVSVQGWRGREEPDVCPATDRGALQPDLYCWHTNREAETGGPEHVLSWQSRRPDRDHLYHGRQLPARGHAAAGKDRDTGLCCGHRQTECVPEGRGQFTHGLSPCGINQYCGQGHAGHMGARHGRTHN